MFKSILAAAALLLFATGADATPIQTITFSGTLASGWDGSAQFGAAGSIAGDAFSVTIAFDPSALSGDSCGASSNNSCVWNFGAGTSEAVTVGGVTHTYAATSGSIQYCACGGDSIYIQAHGAGGLYFGGSFQDSNSLFKSHSNVNNPLLLLDVANAALASAQFQSSGLGGNTSFTATINAITDHYSAAAARVPEAPSLAFMLAGTMLMAMFALAHSRKIATRALVTA